MSDPPMPRADEPSGFRVMGGGLLRALERPGSGRFLHRRQAFVLLAMVAGWLPLVLITAWSGHLDGGSGLPLLSDNGAWVRCFISVPVLVLAEPWVDRFLGEMVDYLRGSGMLPASHTEAFEAEVSRVRRSTDSIAFESALAVIALLTPHVLGVRVVGLLPEGIATWYLDGAGELTFAGAWYTRCAFPIVWFLFLRWALRIGVWGRFLWRLSRMPIVVAPAHPDRMGGMEILTLAPYAMVPILVTLSAQAAAGSGTLIRLDLVELPQLAIPIGAFIFAELLVLLGPQLFFASRAIEARRRSTLAFAGMAAAMAHAFEMRWARPGTPAGVDMLESSHASAMADFAATFDYVRRMQVLGVSPRKLLLSALPLAAPFTPLLLFEHSAREIARSILTMLFL